MSGVFFYKKFNDCDLGDDESPLREKFNEIIKDLEENKLTSQGDIKLIKGKGDIKYLRAKLSDSDRLLFTGIKYNDRDAFVLLEVILNHDYQKSKFLKDKEKIKSIEIKVAEEGVTEKSSDIAEIKDLERAHWLGKLITFSAVQEDIVENAKLPLIVSGSAGSGKTSVALEKFRKIEEKLEEGKVLYITQSENLIKQSKELYEHVYYGKTDKIGIPDRVEFLSIHEFLGKRAENIKRKKPIDRNKFFSWFKERCDEGGLKNFFKKYEKDVDKIFEEFTAVIAGEGLTREDYKELGIRQAIFLQEERENIYSLFEEYKKFIEEDSEYYDPNLVAHKCTEEEIYNAIVLDEVQDLTKSTLGLVLKSLKNKSKSNFLLCGDVNQVVHPSFFSQAKLKSFLLQNEYIGDQKQKVFYNLKKNYRNSEQVTELANRILHFKNYCFGPEDKITKEEERLFFMESDNKNIGSISLIAKDEEQKERVSSSINWAVLVLNDEKKKGARELFGTPLVFNIHEAKGLEFENVILYKFISCKAYDEVLKEAYKNKKEKMEDVISKIRDSYFKKEIRISQPKDKENKSLEKYKFYMNALYVGVSRAISNVCIMDDEEKCNLLKAIKPKKIVSVDIKKEESSPKEWRKKEESSPKEWRNKALELIDKGNIEQAENIAKKLRYEGKEGHAKEIMNALEANGYHKKAQDLDKDKQATSKLKTESQGSSTSKSKIPAEKARKNKNKKTLDKKREFSQDEKERLEKNTEKLFSALKSGYLEMAKKSIKEGANVNAKDSNGYTPLYLAAQNGHKDMVRLLLDNRADVNTKNDKSLIPLHLAAGNGHKEVVELLLERGANIDNKTQEGATPLHVAAENGHRDIVELLLDKRANVNNKIIDYSTPLFSAAGNGHKEVVELLLERGANIDNKTQEGATPLHVAAENGFTSVVQLLLDNGANVNIKNNKWRTPLHKVAEFNHYNVAQLLLGHGAKVNDRSKEGITPLHPAAELGCKDVVELLLKHGADIDTKTHEGFTPLHLSAQNGHRNISEFLLSKGADVNNEIFDRTTPLHVAAYQGHNDIVELLLERGDTVFIVNKLFSYKTTKNLSAFSIN